MGLTYLEALVPSTWGGLALRSLFEDGLLLLAQAVAHQILRRPIPVSGGLAAFGHPRVMAYS